jgi:CubicO group peptidase (beta-lactamase class C family)
MKLGLLTPFVSALSLFGAAGLHSQPLPRSTPEAEGVSSTAVLTFIDEADARVDAMNSFMLVRHGKVIAEGWWAPYAAQEPHVLYSLSKSFTSTAVGLAVAEGRLSVLDPVLKFFPDDAPAEPDKNLQAMRVRDLLTMSTGHHDEAIRDFPFYARENLVKRFLSLPVAHKPGSFFVYNTPATFMQSAIVQKLTGQTVLDYLRPRLFDPLGIENPRWETTAEGISMGGFGLNLRTEDIAKFGQLYLQKGRWNGKQLVPEAWIAEATARQMSNGSDPTSDWDQGYGYQFWRCKPGFYRADGAFGQFCIVMPQYDAVVAITSGTRDMGQVMNLVWDLIVPALGERALAPDATAHTKLTGRLAALTIPPQRGAADSPTAQRIAGKRYAFPANVQSLEWIQFGTPTADGSQSVTFKTAAGEQTVTAAHGSWRKGSADLGPVPEAVTLAASGAWTADDTYTLRLAHYRTPYATTCQLRFAGEQVFLDTERNVAFGERTLPQIVGTAAK